MSFSFIFPNNLPIIAANVSDIDIISKAEITIDISKIRDTNKVERRILDAPVKILDSNFLVI